MNTQNFITLRDARQLCYAEYGDPAGVPVIYFHGMPGSRLEAALLNDSALQLGLRIIALDRPGFGQSTFQPGRRIIDTIDDTHQLADTLQLERFHVLGLSGGCPYALACSWGMPDRVMQTIIMAGLGQFACSQHTRDVPFFARLTLQAAARFPQTILHIYSTLVTPLVKNNTGLLQYLLGSHKCEADQAVWKIPSVAEVFATSVRETFAQGGHGPAYELTLISQPWGFPLQDIRTPVTFWHGGEDKTVPLSMGTENHTKTPASVLHSLPEEGHFSLPVRQMDNILQGFVGK
jgi:pimeloyl-ACP methyl ester carboxylesterase